MNFAESNVFCLVIIILLILIHPPITVSKYNTLTISETLDKYEITGRLLDDQQAAPVENQRVSVHLDSGEELSSTTTDSEGHFTLSYEWEAVSAQRIDSDNIPNGFTLGSSYPNPFNPQTTIPLQTAKNMRADIVLYDIVGREIERTNVELQQGVHHIHLRLGSSLAQGQYLVRVQGEGYASTVPVTYINTGSSHGYTDIAVQQVGSGARAHRTTAPLTSGDQQDSESTTSETENTSEPTLSSTPKTPKEPVRTPHDETAELLLVVEGSARYSGTEIGIPAGKHHNAGVIALSKKNTYWAGTLSGEAELFVDGMVRMTSGFTMHISNMSVRTDAWIEEQQTYDAWATAFYKHPGYEPLNQEVAQLSLHYIVETPMISGEIDGLIALKDVWREEQGDDVIQGLRYGNIRPVYTRWKCIQGICSDPKTRETSILALDGGALGANIEGNPMPSVVSIPLDFVIDGDQMTVELLDKFGEGTVTHNEMTGSVSFSVTGMLYRVHWQQEILEAGRIYETDEHQRKEIHHEENGSNDMDPMERFELFLDAQSEIEKMTGTPDNETRLEMFRGKLFSRVKNLEGTYEVSTPQAVAGVRGTEFLMEVYGDTVTVITAVEGELEVSSRDGSGTVTLQEHEQTVILDGEAPSEPEKFDEIPAIWRWWEQASLDD